MIKTRGPKYFCFIATLLIAISPLFIAKSTVMASEVDSTTGKTEQNSRIYLQTPDQEIKTAEATGEEFTKQQIANGYLEVDSSGNLEVTPKWIDEIKANLVIQNRDKDYDVYADGAAIVLVDKNVPTNPKPDGVTKIVNTWKGFDLYLKHSHCENVTDAQQMVTVFAPFLGAPLGTILAAICGAQVILIQRSDKGQGVIIAFIGTLGINKPLPIPHWIASQ